MGTVKTFQLLDIRIKLNLFQNQGTSGCKGLYFCGRERNFSGIFNLSAHVFTIHNLIDETLLSVQNIPQSGIKASLGDIGIAGHFIINVALPECASVSLFHITRAPWGIQMMNGNHTFLSVHANTHFPSRTDQDTDLALIYICEQLFLFCVSVRFMDKRDFLCGNFLLNKPGFNVLIQSSAFHIDFRIVCLSSFRFALPLGRGHITENQLGSFDLAAFTILLNYIVGTAVDLASFLIRKTWINHSLGIGNLSAVAGDLQHIVNAGIYVFHFVCALLKQFHVILLELPGITHHYLNLPAFHFRDF